MHSDIDTDTAALTDTTLPAPPKTRTNTELNLLVLRRYNPSIIQILQIAPFAVVYTFNPESGAWEKSGTEGTLFVCQLAPLEGSRSPRYNVVILNRKSLENFVAELKRGDDVEIADPYVILQVKKGEKVDIVGLWIFDDGMADGLGMGMRELVAGKIQECAYRAEENASSAVTEEEGGVDEQEVVEAYGTQNAGQVHQFGLDGSLETESSAPAVQPVQPEPAGQPMDLLRLFGKAPGQQQMSQQQPVPMPQFQQFQQLLQPPAFGSIPDTNFFRNSQSPAVQTQNQPPPQTQQNTLLNLFKSTTPG